MQFGVDNWESELLNHVKSLLVALKPFYEATKFFESESLPRTPCVLSWLEILSKSIQCLPPDLKTPLLKAFDEKLGSIRNQVTLFSSAACLFPQCVAVRDGDSVSSICRGFCS